MSDDRTPREASNDSQELREGSRVGRYLVIQVVGTGGMGVVYRAFDPDLERLVALKLLRPVRGDDESSVNAHDHLLLEAKALARVSHPHVVAVYDVGTFGGDVFIAMELVEGQTLGDWLASAPRTPREIMAAFLDAGEGLAAAHQAGVVHRDFKPDNVIVARDGRIRVLDFGIARAPVGSMAPGAEPESPSAAGAPTEHAGTPEHAHTITLGALSGTPRYMAPEQHLGEPSDARTDEFSFCVSLYEALQGEHPFGSDDMPLARIERVVRGTPVAPAASKVPPWLRRVLLRGLSCEPGGRYPSMRALLDALRADPALARRRWLSRAGIGLLAGVALFGVMRTTRERSMVCTGAEARLAGVWDAARDERVRTALHATGAAYADEAYLGAKRALDAYARSWVLVRKEACEATEVRREQSADLLDLRMTCLDDRLAAMRAQVDVLAAADVAVAAKATQAAEALPPIALCSDAAALRAPIRLPSDPLTRQRFEVVREATARGRALNESGKYQDANGVLEHALSDAHALAYRPAEAEAAYALGVSRDRLGRYKEAEETFTDAVLLAEAGRSDAISARAWSRLAWVVGERQGRYSEAQRLARHAHAKIDRMDDRDALEGELLDIESALAYREHRYEDAIALGRGAIEHLRRAYGPSHALVAHALVDVADAEMELGKLNEALADYHESLVLEERTLGPEHPDLASSLNNQGIALKRLLRFDEATASYERSLAIREKALGADHPQNAATIYNLGEVLAAAGRFDRALPMEQRALALLERDLGPAHPDVAEALYGVAEVLRALGRAEDARADYARALAIDEKAFGANHPALAGPLTGLGEVACAEHRPEEAIAPLSRALTLRQADPRDVSALASTRFALGRALYESARDKRRGHALVAEARSELASLGPVAENDLTAVDAWTVAHALDRR